MNGCDLKGTLVLSIDLELNLDCHESSLHRQLDDVRSALVGLTRDMALPATWAVADPMLSAASDSILRANCGHEVAVLGDRAWLGAGCGRERLTRELARRFSAPRKAGIPLSTLVLRNVEELSNVDLLIGQHVTAICGPASDQHRPKTLLPPTHFGFWQPPSAWRAPLRASWGLPAAWQVRREIKRAIRARSLVHLRFDATRLIAAPDSALDAISSILRYAADRREAGNLHIKTIAELALHALTSRAAHPSRSILRPAA